MIWSPPTIPKRRPGWERPFTQIMGRHLASPFGWGASDCLSVPAELCAGMTGVDPMAGLPSYGSEAEAEALLLRLGFTDVEAALKAVFPAVPPALARRGDVGVRRVRGMVSALVVLSNGTAVGKGARGPVSVPVLSLSAAFMIGAR